jgi:5S rRNA maturation endonuclease (ribonuclease M5)
VSLKNNKRGQKSLRNGRADSFEKEHRYVEVANALALARQRNNPNQQTQTNPPSKSHAGEESEGWVGGGAGIGCPVLVEGLKDERALRGLDFSGPIELVNRGWSMPKLCAYLYEKYGCQNKIDGGAAIILLMDWDRTGGKIQRELIRRLDAYGIEMSLEPRKTLGRFFSSEIKVVEGLRRFTDELLLLMDEYDVNHPITLE